MYVCICHAVTEDEVINEQLSAELTAINQYLLHAKIQENLGVGEQLYSAQLLEQPSS